MPKSKKDFKGASMPFRPLSAEEAWKVSKEPKWFLDMGVMYLNGLIGTSFELPTSAAMLNNSGYFTLWQQIIKAGKDDKVKLQLREAKTITEELCYIEPEYDVEPEALLAWARTFNPALPIFKLLKVAEAKLTAPTYSTPDMELMRDAIVKFWESYDTINPDASLAPYKDDVVNWLVKEAEKRGLDFSKTRAEIMDTILRHPSARRGGNSR